MRVFGLFFKEILRKICKVFQNPFPDWGENIKTFIGFQNQGYSKETQKPYPL